MSFTPYDKVIAQSGTCSLVLTTITSFFIYLELSLKFLLVCLFVVVFLRFSHTHFRFHSIFVFGLFLKLAYLCEIAPAMGRLTSI